MVEGGERPTTAPAAVVAVGSKGRTRLGRVSMKDVKEVMDAEKSVAEAAAEKLGHKK